MKRRAFVLMVSLALFARSRSAFAQEGATQIQIDLALAFVGLAALRTRYGDAHPEVTLARARIESLSVSLRSALARGDAIDPVRARDALAAELADTRARLAEFSQRCGSGHPDMQSAHARAAALEDAIAHVTSDGPFFPPV